MTWNWQKKEWPHFDYDASALEALEDAFLRGSGVIVGSLMHLGEEDKSTLTIDLISTEALKTSEIEGELLNRDSLQSSIRRQFGLQTDGRRVSPAEQGVSEMMVDLYRTFASPLEHQTLWRWHRMLTTGRRDLRVVGHYRTHVEPMQVVSGRLDEPTVHFEAPPSACMEKEMGAFVKWFNATGPDGKRPLPALTRAGMAHLYFVCVHPFEDGNGRIGRAIAEKAIAQSLGQPSLTALAYQIEKQKKRYYDALEAANKDNTITDWLVYFGETLLAAQQTTAERIGFLIAKAKLYEKLHGQINPRQEKVLERLFRAGPEGFTGGLSAENYLRITQTSRATATRDLTDLVAKGALTKTGQLKHTRYWLNIGNLGREE